MTPPSKPSRKAPHRQRGRARQTCQLSLISIALLLQWGHVATAAPSQTPLINRPGNKPKPNVMLTLDDSGSMTYQYAPERSFTRNGVVVDFPNDGKVYMHPAEIRKNIFFFQTAPGYTPDSNHDSHFVTAESRLEGDALLLQQQMRSPDVNSIYYNPSIRYLPWQKVIPGTGTLTSFDNAKFTAAHLDPAWMDPETRGSADARVVDLSDTSLSYLVKWYCGATIGNDGNGVYGDNKCAAEKRSFNPALFYLLEGTGSTPPSPKSTSSFVEYDLNKSTGPIQYKRAYPNRADDCVISGNTTTCALDAEKQNFANWFVYYRSRLMIAQGAMPETFNSFADTMRVGWATIHADSYSIDGQASTTVQQGVRDLNSSHKAAFSTWLRNLGVQAGTPTRGAVQAVGEYFKRTDVGSPWRNNVGSLATTASPSARGDLSCRRAYNIVVTDGYYRLDNDDTRIKDNKRNDDKASPLGRPFTDEATGTLADYAMRYWANDLQADIPNEVPPITASDSDTALAAVKGNPATWQHLTQFFVGFGVTGVFTPDDSTLKGLINGNATSTPPGTTYWQDSPNQIDDLWHAAINSRGAYFNVNNNEELKKALTSALSLSERNALKEAGVATASSTLSAGNFKYVPEYRAVSWVGDIRAYTLDASGNMGTTPSWVASQQLPSWDQRNIHFWKKAPTASNPDAGSADDFTYSNVGGNKQTLLSSALVDYIKGRVVADSTFRDRVEVTVNGNTTTSRVNVLPDFVNATPLYVKGALNLGYSTLPGAPNATTGKQYSDFLADKASRTKSALLIGGNGGMLHAFDASTGVETFGFIPSASLANLPKIARSDYGSSNNFHQYFVDGPLVESDAYFAIGNNDAAWHNIAVGTMGAGGRTVFALHLKTSDPTAFDSSSVLWESSSARSADMGYITTEPQVGVLPDGSWKVFVGNGVDSDSGNAALLMIDVATGDVSSVVVYTRGNGAANGLGGVTLIRNQLGQVIGAYAGDMQGNLWRFEHNGSAMVAGYGGRALFKAYDSAQSTATTQPILAAPAVVSHPMGGQVVVANTGRLLYDKVSSTDLGDAGSTQTQTVYGIWDRTGFDQLTTTLVPAFALTPEDRNKLQGQSITGLSSLSTTTSTFYDLSTNSVSWGASTGGEGWHLDLKVPDTSANNTTYSYPKAIYPPQKLGNGVLVSAVKPGAIEESCSGTQATGYGFFIKALTGARSSRASIDANGNGQFEASEIAVGGFSTPGGGPGRVLTGSIASSDGSTTKNDCLTGSDQLADSAKGLRACDDPTKRIKDRIWRQLLNPPKP